MHLRASAVLLLLQLAAFSGLRAQATLLSEDFNDCQFPPTWQVHITGNQNAIYYVTDAITNNDDIGQSMNGSCFLFIDDDALGDNTPGYVLDVISAPFDASLYPQNELTVDVHYRDWSQANEYFAILVTDGVTETELTRFDNTNPTGDSIFKFVTFKADLSLFTHASNVRLIFRYDDAGGFDWWAGFDNVKIVGSGTGTNVITEPFNGCTKPTGWETQIISGQADWVFGKDVNPKSGNGKSIDGSCFALFDDDMLGDSALYSTARILSPWFDGTVFGRYYLDYDMIFRFYQKELFTVFVQHDNGTESVVSQWNTDVGGPLFNTSVHQALDLSPYRSSKMRVVFEYDDGKTWAWWAGIDNVKIRGEGAANDLCKNAFALLTGDTCLHANNRTAVFDGPVADCTSKNVGGLWYRWKSDFDGFGKLITAAQFNDVVNVYTGGCTNLQQVSCNNRDEHGFTGESTYFPTTNGQEYLIRVSGADGGFGVSRGNFCLRMEQTPSLPAAPANDDCAGAIHLNVGSACLPGNNFHAGGSTPLPSNDRLARSDVWYAFTAPTLAPGESLEFQSNADFSDILTVYEGGCNALSEVGANFRGRTLDLTGLTAGKNYWIQVAGNFASVEGSLCAQLVSKTAGTPPNNDCLAAVSVPLGAVCTSGSNAGASFSGHIPPCVPEVDRDIWFKFTASASGSVRINSGADFEHVLAVWEGSCDSLKSVFCKDNPVRCDGFVTVGSLQPGKTYYVQIASRSALAGPVTGDVCLKILDGSAQPDFTPMNLQVHATCIGQNMANLTINLTGGVLPYSIQGAQNGAVLASGDAYLIVITDAIGCERSAVGSVDSCSGNACTLAVSLSPTLPKCAGSSDGNLATNAAGGTPPYTYLWSDGSVNATLSNIPHGVYSVTITDQMGCQTTITQTLPEPDPIMIVPNTIVHPLAGTTNGAIYLTVSGGSGAFAFVWQKDGQDFVHSQDLTNAPAGMYQLIITDGNGCTGTFSYNLTEVVSTGAPVQEIFAEIFPNPAHDKARLAVSCPIPTDLYLNLVDGTGKTLRSWKVEKATEQNIPIDVQNLSAGVYQVRIFTEGQQLNRKLVVTR
jgi:hypothetical protein